MPAGIPSTLPKWAKTLLKPDSIFFSPVLLAAVDYLGLFSTSEAAAPSTWRHVQIEWSLTGQIDRADHFITTFDLAKITGGNVQPDWGAGDYTTAQTAFETMVASWVAQAPASLHALEYRYYIRTFNPPTDEKPYPPSGPPDHVVTKTPGGGSSAANMIPQAACTHTERTPYRKHWGRVYWPYPAPGLLTDTGRFQTSLVDQVATFVHDNYDTMMGAGLFPVVPVVQVNKAPSRSLLTVTAVAADDVPDVIRRRRPKHTQHQKILPLTP